MLAGGRQWVWLAAVLAMVLAMVAAIWPAAPGVQAAGVPAAHAGAEQSSPVGALVVRGRVVAQASFWSADGNRIESRSTVALRYTLGGTGLQESVQPGPIAVHTVGGKLPTGLGMVASHLPALTLGEEVILFLQRSPLAGENGYTIADGKQRKFTVWDGGIVLAGWEGTEGSAATAEAALSLGEFYGRLQGAGLATALPADWQAREQAALPLADAAGESAAVAPGAIRTRTSSGYKWPSAAVAYKVNVNTMHAAAGSAGDYLAAVRRAANTWTYVEEGEIALVYDGPTNSTTPGFNGANEILFVDEGREDETGSSRALATTLIFYIDDTIVEADVKINDAYAWSAASSPPTAAYDLQSVLLHELGHLLGLGHDAEQQAVMFGSLAPGTAKRKLGGSDRQGVAAVYPCAPGPVCNPQTEPDPPFAPEAESVATPAEPPALAEPAPAVPEPAHSAALYLPLVQGGP